VEVFLLAKNTGTSSHIIERFHGRVKLERMAKGAAAGVARRSGRLRRLSAVLGADR
jgi:hypothetical protein